MRRAICIGVSLQSDSSLPSLPHCESDIVLVSNFLQSDLAKFDVLSIRNPTSQNIRSQLWEVLSQVTPDDQLVIYFTGHGKRNTKRELQLCLQDTKENALAITSISFNELLLLCNEAGAESVLIILDCCFSGAAEKSILTKGSDEILVPHEEAILASKGISVLSSCNSVELSYLDEKENMSTFTATLLTLCKRRVTEISGWLTVGQLYEELRFSVRAHSPKLIGNNSTFPICRGDAPLQFGQPPPSETIEVRDIIEEYPLLYGILVMPYYRAWLIALPIESAPDASEQVGKGIYVIYNSEELYSNKISEAKQYIGETLNELEYLANFLSTTLLLLHPVAIEATMYKRFQGSDRKYILRTSQTLRKRCYPIITQQQYGYTISSSDQGFMIHQIPDDYLREAFGLIVDQNVNGTAVMFREDSFSINAKYLKIESYTNRVYDSLTFGRDLSRSELSFSSPQEKEQFKSVVKSARFQSEAPSIRAVAGALVVESKEQIHKVNLGYRAKCALCLDEKFRLVDVNNRLYRIPCRSCNSGYDNSWRAFPNL